MRNMSKIKYWIKWITMMGAIFFAEPLIATSTHEISDKNASFQNRILYYVNQYRAQHHLSPLKMQKHASIEAYNHSRDMANKKMGFGHGGFSGRYKRLYRHGKNCRGASENVAYYRMDAKKLVNGWIASRGHRRNILGHYNQTGIGVARSQKDGWGYMTQIFLQCE